MSIFLSELRNAPLNSVFKGDGTFKLLLKHGANVSIPNKEQDIPLMIAVRNGN